MRKQRRRSDSRNQCLCFRYTDSTVPLLLKSEISSFQPASALVQLGLCRTSSETTLLVFSRGSSFVNHQNRIQICHMLLHRLACIAMYNSNIILHYQHFESHCGHVWLLRHVSSITEETYISLYVRKSTIWVSDQV